MYFMTWCLHDIPMISGSGNRISYFQTPPLVFNLFDFSVLDTYYIYLFVHDIMHITYLYVFSLIYIHTYVRTYITLHIYIYLYVYIYITLHVTCIHILFIRLIIYMLLCCLEKSPREVLPESSWQNPVRRLVGAILMRSRRGFFTWPWENIGKRRKTPINSGIYIYISGWWLGTWILFSIYWECHHPIWLSYFSEGLKPPTSC